MAQPTSFTLAKTGAAKTGAMLFQNGTALTAGATLKLCTGSNLTEDSTGTTVTANEVSAGGYSAFSLTVDSNSFNGTTGVQEVVFDNFQFQPDGANVAFQQAALLLSDGTLYGFWTWAATETLTDGLSYPFTGLTVAIGNEGDNVSPQ